ncbi:pentulose/hexulose kinase [Sphaerochaeta pleomorpha str. Grapes]|uniref:Pentulose/hexulose kinase n=1 Tax=Sphaerochaeta pleomorpha (strain ATCC BAA-1885 / DSM 22778 / Grapes) TaxID=158190 RepID=G8QTR4_SPHPG|nr:FGGY-family carbohydrate kinase [Sphaerochaeta pleomorpha]AEV28029.1 pentulose/hexulose kinase [Sphaerochaeta pleomorpha str. Grapes]
MILTLDIGTTTLKGALFDDAGTLCSFKYATVPSQGFLIDPFQWSLALKTVCSSFPSLSEVDTVTISGNGPTLVPVFGNVEDRGGILSCDSAMARLWHDRRATQESEEVSRLANSFVDASFSLPKALYVYNREPEIYEKTKFFLSSYDFFNYLLTGEAKTILHAKGSERWYWNDMILEQLALDKTKFPAFCYPGQLIGTVSSLASLCLGIGAGATVYAGAPDFFVSILGTGAVSLGRVCDRSGTSEGINLCTKEPLGDNRLMAYRHPIKPYYNVSGIISSSGQAILWAKNLFGLKEASYDRLYEEMAEAKPGSGNLIFLPYLCGERAPIWDAKARGVFNGLALETGRAEMLRSVAEGVCFAMRDVITVMEDLGAKVGELRLSGGPTHSTFLNQLKADITRREVLIPMITDAELVGDLIIAQTAKNRYASLSEAAEDLVSIKKRYTPNPAVQGLYEDLFAVYRSTYQKLKERKSQ